MSASPAAGHTCARFRERSIMADQPSMPPLARVAGLVRRRDGSMWI
jgi:hypothetical protein